MTISCCYYGFVFRRHAYDGMHCGLVTWSLRCQAWLDGVTFGLKSSLHFQSAGMRLTTLVVARRPLFYEMRRSSRRASGGARSYTIRARYERAVRRTVPRRTPPSRMHTSRPAFGSRRLSSPFPCPRHQFRHWHRHRPSPTLPPVPRLSLSLHVS